LEKIRKAAVAGQFYPGDENTLKKQIIECFLSPRGPGSLPKENLHGKRGIHGVIVPHAGYIYSGAIAAHAYHSLAEDGFAETFIIVGPNHTGMGSGVSIVTDGTWETPLGMVQVNKTMAEQMWKGIIDRDEDAHMYEHSIEVQLPFLQFIASKKFDFIPICMAMQDYETSKEIGEIIADTIKKTDKHVVVIASSDFSHVGFNYMSMPPRDMRVDKYAEKQDEMAIEEIIKMDPQSLINTVQSKNITMCGYGPVAAMLTAAKKLGAKKAELLRYSTSYEVHPGSSCVGYAAITVQ